MNAEIIVIAEGHRVEESKVRSALEAIPGVKATKIGSDRGLAQGAAKAIKFALKFVGGSAKVGDALIEQATKQLAGAKLKIKIGEAEIEVSNVNRSQVIDALAKAAEIAKAAGNL
jgi:hypothetical protein